MKADRAASMRRDLSFVLKGFSGAKGAGLIVAMLLAVLSVLSLNVIGEIRMNRWQGAFFRAVEERKFADVGTQSLIFLAIVAVLLTLVILQNWLVARIKIALRDMFTTQLLDEWMIPGRAYRLNMASAEAPNPDQRIQDDVLHLSEMSGDLGAGAARSALMLISFIAVLWTMSRGISFSVAGYAVEVPGYMVWFAIIYAAAGSWLAARVGKPLVSLNDARYGREAEFRFALVRVNESAEAVALYNGERDERRILDSRLKGTLDIMGTLSFAHARLTWITCGHGWMVVILPVLVALPGFAQGRLDFGGLMMVVGAFGQVQQSMRWFVENFFRIAEWRASLHRVAVFREALFTADEFENNPQMISVAAHPTGYLEFDRTSVSLVDGEVVIADATAEIRPGERVLLVGESGSGKSMLFRAIGGLWPWGSGEIKLPPRSEMMFLPQRPYVPLGTLAAAIAYPDSAGKMDREELRRCLEKVNLGALSSQLDETASWDKTLSLGQQQRLAFARLLLHKPKWIFLDEATSALDDANQDRVMRALIEELPDAALLSIGHRPGLEEYHTRSLHLLMTRSGRVLTRKPKAAPKEAIGESLRRKVRLSFMGGAGGEVGSTSVGEGRSGISQVTRLTPSASCKTGRVE